MRKYKRLLLPFGVDNITPQLPTAVTNYWDARTSAQWGGRVILNVVSPTNPTLNLVPDPFVMVDEDGGATPTRSVFDAGLVDPLGGTNANLIGFTAALQSLAYVIPGNSPDIPSDTYTSRLSIKQADASAGSVRIGANNTVGQFTSQALTASWATIQNSNVAYSGGSIFTLGFTSHTGAPNPLNAAAFNLQLYDSATAVLPSDAVELAAAQAGHVKAPVAHVNSIPLDVYSWLQSSGNFDNVLACFLQPTVTAMTIGGMVDVQSNPASSYAHLIGVATQQQAGVTALAKGQIGVAQDTYQLYCNPALAAASGRSTDYLLNQGPVSLILSVTGSRCIAYINGVPQFEDTSSASVTGWTSFLLERLMMMAYDGQKKRIQQSNRLADPANFFFYAPSFLSASDVIAVDRRMRSDARASGKRAGVRKECVIGCGDSLTAFSAAPFWKMSQSSSLRPGLHTGLDAIGGSKYVAGAVAGSGSYNDPTRQALRRTMIVAALAAGYEEVIVQWQYGTNDVTAGVLDRADWQVGMATIDAMIFADKAACDDGTGRLKTAIVTPPPNAGATATRQGYLDAYTAACRTNYASRGFDYLIDLAAYVPSGWASLYAASLDAFTTGVDNNVFLGGGLHWVDGGGLNAANAVHVPFYAARLAVLTGIV